MNKELKEYDYALISLKNSDRLRIARFNGFGQDKGRGGKDWSGDSGFSTDSWMHDEVEWLILLKHFHVEADGDTKGVVNIIYGEENDETT